MDAELIWRSKSDEEVVAAARRLADYEEDGQRIIRAEFERRGLTADSPSFDRPVSMAPNGIGGWLVLPGLTLALSCVLGVVAVAQVLSVGADALVNAAGGVLLLLLVIQVGLLAFTVFATIRFMGRKRNAPSIVIALFATRVAANGLLLFAARSLDAPALANGASLDLGRAFVYACIWIPYFSVSKRVKETFVN